MAQNLSFDELPRAVSLISERLDAVYQIVAQIKEPQPSIQPDKLLSVEQAAQMLRLSKATVYSKVSRGELPTMKQGNRLYFSHQELLEHLKRSRKLSFNEAIVAADTYTSKKKGERYAR